MNNLCESSSTGTHLHFRTYTTTGIKQQIRKKPDNHRIFASLKIKMKIGSKRETINFYEETHIR